MNCRRDPQQGTWILRGSTSARSTIITSIDISKFHKLKHNISTFQNIKIITIHHIAIENESSKISILKYIEMSYVASSDSHYFFRFSSPLWCAAEYTDFLKISIHFKSFLNHLSYAIGYWKNTEYIRWPPETLRKKFYKFFCNLFPISLTTSMEREIFRRFLKALQCTRSKFLR